MPDAPEDAPGGLGEFTKFTRADLRLARRAARQDWGVPDEAKNEAVFQALKWLSGKNDNRRKTALQFLLACDLADVRAARLALAREKLEAEKARAAPGAGGMAEVHDRMLAYLDDDDDDGGGGGKFDGGAGPGPGLVPPPA